MNAWLYGGHFPKTKFCLVQLLEAPRPFIMGPLILDEVADGFVNLPPFFTCAQRLLYIAISQWELGVSRLQLSDRKLGTRRLLEQAQAELWNNSEQVIEDVGLDILVVIPGSRVGETVQLYRYTHWGPGGNCRTSRVISWCICGCCLR